MYPLSGMQRTLVNQKTLAHPLLLVLVWLYPPLTALVPWLPPLLAPAYLLWRQAFFQHQWWHWVVWSIYMLLIEAVWGLPLFLLWGSAMVTAFWIESKIKALFRPALLVAMMSGLVFDLFYLAILLFIGFLWVDPYVTFDPILLYYLASDLVGVILL